MTCWNFLKSFVCVEILSPNSCAPKFTQVHTLAFLNFLYFFGNCWEFSQLFLPLKSLYSFSNPILGLSKQFGPTFSEQAFRPFPPPCWHFSPAGPPGHLPSPSPIPSLRQGHHPPSVPWQKPNRPRPFLSPPLFGHLPPSSDNGGHKGLPFTIAALPSPTASAPL
jgi:hypothetical protein